MLDEAHFDDLSSQKDLVAAVVADRKVGCILRGVLRDGASGAALAKLARDAAETPRSVLCDGAYTLGIMLAPTVAQPQGPSLEPYLQAAQGFRAETLLPKDDLERVQHALSILAGGRAVVCPTAADGRRYAFATLRVFEDGASAPAHNDTYPNLACQAELDALRDRRGQLSWYVPLSLPEDGGALTIFPLKHGDPGAQDPEHAVRSLEGSRYDIGVGDMVVFDGGRYAHRIERCCGRTPRRTLGGFASLSADGASLLAWS